MAGKVNDPAASQGQGFKGGDSLHEEEPRNISTRIVLESNSLPMHVKRREVRKKDVTCLRSKDAQYHDLNKALDLLIDGPSQA